MSYWKPSPGSKEADVLEHLLTKALARLDERAPRHPSSWGTGAATASAATPTASGRTARPRPAARTNRRSAA